MESWRKCWRDGFVPGISTPGLRALREALLRDDPRLVQGVTTDPQALQCVEDERWPPEAACAVGYCGWRGDGLGTVGEVEEYFATACFEADGRLGEPAGCRHFLFAFDETPRQEFWPLLLAEVNRELALRQAPMPEARAALEAEMDKLESLGPNHVSLVTPLG
jgi:hypothetical protein